VAVDDTPADREECVAIATGQARLLLTLADGGLLPKDFVVCELGSQEPLPKKLATVMPAIGKSPLLGNFSASSLYKYFGAAKYVSVDFNGEHGALPFDLNENLRSKYDFSEKFDLVTNFGTTEHCFNQFEAFRNIHELCKSGGYMAHTLPTQGWGRHCFFRYDANLFEDLAAANGYEILVLEPFLPLKRNNAEAIQQVLTLCRHVDPTRRRVRASQAGRKRATLNEDVEPTEAEIAAAIVNVGKRKALFNVTMACLLRKTTDANFVVPVQNVYKDDIK